MTKTENYDSLLTGSSPSVIQKNQRKSIYSKIKYAIRNPSLSLAYLIFGKEKFYKLINEHSCLYFKKPSNYLEQLMVERTSMHEHLPTLYMLTIEFNLKNILELGTQFGNSTIVLLLAAKEINGKVATVDVDPCLDARDKIKNLQLDKWCTFVQNDDLNVEWNEPIDHLFIDSNHSYNHVLEQLQKYEPFVKPGGFITMHDIVMHEFLPDGTPTQKINDINSVLRAINDYIKNRNDLRFYKYFNCNGLGVIRKRISQN